MAYGGAHCAIYFATQIAPDRLGRAINFTPEHLEFAAFVLAVHSPHLRAFGWPGGSALFLDNPGTPDQQLQPFEGVFAILFLRAILLRLDHHNTVFGHSSIFEPEQLLLIEVWKRGSLNIKAQVNGTGYLVHILATGALRANGLQLNLGGGYTHMIGYR